MVVSKYLYVGHQACEVSDTALSNNFELERMTLNPMKIQLPTEEEDEGGGIQIIANCVRWELGTRLAMLPLRLGSAYTAAERKP